MKDPASLIRKLNRDKILDALRQQRSATRPQIAGLTGLSVVTVHAVTVSLIESGEILVDEGLVSSGGRPAAVLRFNATFRLGLILYTTEHAQRDRLHAVVLDLYGAALDRAMIEPEQLNEWVFDPLVEQMLDRYPAIRMIGLGLPGRKIRGQMESIDYVGLSGNRLIRHLSDRFNRPVVFENDVNAAVHGYCATHQAKELDVVGVYIPARYPLGAGISLRGRIHQGRDGFAGEVKYLPGPIDWQDPEAVSAHLNDALRILILTFTCLVNPDRIVFYREGLTQAMLDQALDACCLQFDRSMLPDVCLSDRFQADYAEGLARMTLQAMDQLIEETES